MNKAGYGVLGGPLAHRIAYEFFVGKIPNGLHVLHRCDNPPCINPGHLFLGTIKDNNDDKFAKGRQAQGEMFNRKFTDADILSIRARCRSGESQSTVARELKVRQSCISRIVNRKVWQHLP